MKKINIQEFAEELRDEFLKLYPLNNSEPGLELLSQQFLKIAVSVAVVAIEKYHREYSSIDSQSSG